ncbi:MAG: WD40 repeat domain-containing protein [Planctomycetota bacterium]
MKPTQLKFLLGTLFVSIVLSGCGKQDESHPTPAATSSSSSGPQVPQPAPAPGMRLPEFHGLYALDGDRLVELGKQAKFEDCELDSKATFILFDKTVSTGLSSLAGSPRLQRSVFVRYRVSDVVILEDISGLQEATVSSLNQWKKEGKPVECRTKPIPGQADMIQIVPPQPLQPGAYEFANFKAVFSVALAQNERCDEFQDSYRPVADLDNLMVRGKALATEALEGKDWKKVLALTRGALKVRSDDAPFIGLRNEASYGLAMEEASRLEAAKDFGAALTAYKRARDWKNSDKAAEEAVSRVRDLASKDPVAFVEISKSAPVGSDCPQSLAFSADGKRVILVRGCPNRFEPVVILTLEENLRGIVSRTERNNGVGMMQKFALSSDGGVLAIGSPDSPYTGDDRRIVLWDVAKNCASKTIENVEGKFWSMAFDRGKTRVATGGNDKIWVWEVSEGASQKPASAVHEEESWVTALTFSDDGKLLASVGGSDYGKRDVKVKIWNPTSLKTIQTCVGHQALVNSIAFSRDGKLLASGGEEHIGWNDSVVKVWDVPTGKEIRSFSEKKSEVTSLVFSHDAKYVLSGTKGGRILVWNIETGKCSAALQGHTAAVGILVLNSDGTRLASASADETVRMWGMSER